MSDNYTARWHRALEREASKLLPDPERVEFIEAVKQGQSALPCLVLTSKSNIPEIAKIVSLPWETPELRALGNGPELARHAEHEAGNFYMLDAASVFMAQAVADLGPQLELCVDVCAAPGGKSILARHYTQPIKVVSNEVIR